MTKLTHLVGFAALARGVYGAAAASSQAGAKPAVAAVDGNAQNGGCVQAADVNIGSFFDGNGAIGSTDTQAKSLTDKFNFIAFCNGKTLTQGTQQNGGSCNPIAMGDIPKSTNMITAAIQFPRNGDTVEEGKDFNITVQVNNLDAGSFTNAVTTYYTAPQQINAATGNIIGHTHLTVQDLGNDAKVPPDPTKFAFFKGVNDAGNGKGLLAAVVAGGLPPATYRVCSMTSASNHQPVLMPIAQRGAQDDCQQFTVTPASAADKAAESKAAAASAAAASAAAAKNATAAAAADKATATKAAAASAASAKNATASAADSKAAADKAAADKAAASKAAVAKAAADKTKAAAAAAKPTAAADKAKAAAPAAAATSKAAAAKDQAKTGGKVRRLERLSRRTFVA